MFFEGRLRQAIILVLGAISINSVRAQSPQELSSAAAAAMKRQDYPKAELYYEKLLQAAPNAAEIHSNLGLARYLQKKIEPAEQAFEDALLRNSGLFVPNFFLGRIHFETGRYQRALTLLKNALELQPQQETVSRFLAAVLVGLKRFDEAILQYKGLLKNNQKDIESLYSLGLVYMDLGQKAFDQLANFQDSGFFPLVTAELYSERPDWEAVTIRNYRQAVTASPEIPGLRIALGMFLLKVEEWDAAKQALDEELQLDPYSYEARFGISVFHLFTGDTRAALHELNEAARIRPQFFDPLPPMPVKTVPRHLATDHAKLEQEANQGSFAAAYLLTELSSHLGRGEQTVWWRTLAETRRDKLIDEYHLTKELPGQPPGYDGRSLGLQHIHEKRYEDGLRLLLDRRAEIVTDSEIRNALVRTLFQLGRFEELINLLESMELNDDPEMFYVLGASYKNLALQTLEKIVEVDPESVRAHQLLGDALLAQDLFQQAAREYETAVKIEPRNPPLLYSLATAYFNQLEFERAAENYQRVLELDPFHAEAHLMQGSCLLRLGRPEEAIPLLRKALKLEPELIRAHVPMGRALAELDRTEEAIEHFELGAHTDEDGSVHYQLFNLYRKLGKKEKAKDALLRSQKLRRTIESRREWSQRTPKK